MKTLKKISNVVIISIICLFAVSCAKDNSSLVKSSKLAVKFLTIKGGVANSTSSTKGSTSLVSGFTLNTVKISIANLTIEENSGNDVEQQGNNNNGGSDKENNSKEGSNAEIGDILLPGPFVLEVINGKLTLDQIDIYAGTFKKVDFTFLINNETGFDGSSIIVNGSYQKADGTILPVVLKSGFNQQVQLPLVNGGIVVAANSSVSVSVVLDISAWINSLDLSTAVVLNNEILIDNTNNKEFLKLFESNLTSGIEIEN